MATLGRMSLWRRVFWWGVTLLLCVLAFFSARGAYSMYVRMQEARSAAEASRAALTDLQDREENLRRTVEHLASPRGVEEELRTRFGVVRPGEESVTIIFEQESASPLHTGLFDWLKNLF